MESSSRDFAYKLVRARFCDVSIRNRENTLSSVELFQFVDLNWKPLKTLTQRTAASLAKQHPPLLAKVDP